MPGPSAQPSPDLSKSPQVIEAQEIAARISAHAQALVIKSPAQYEEAASFLMQLKAEQQRVTGLLESLTSPANLIIRAARALFNPRLELIQKAEDQTKNAMLVFQQAEERARREAQRKANEEAARIRREAEANARRQREEAARTAALEREAAERRRREQEEADRKARQEREAAARAEREREEAANRGDEEAAANAERERVAAHERAQAAQRTASSAAKSARKAETKADTIAARGEERASEHEETAAITVAPVINRSAPKISGIATREDWKYEILDASLVPGEFKVIDRERLQRVVSALKGDSNIPGVRVWSERVIASKAASST